MQLRPVFTGAAGSAFTATIISFFVATIMPQPVPQNLHTALSHFQPASVFFTTPNNSSGTLFLTVTYPASSPLVVTPLVTLLFCAFPTVPLFIKLFYLLELLLAHALK